MKNFLKILLVLSVAIIAYFSYKYITFKPTLISANLDPKYEFYMTASEEEILDHINKPNSTIKQADVLSLIDREMTGVLEVLLNKYAINPDIGEKTYGFSPLLYASEMLKPKSVKLLIKYGADLNFKNRKGKTALIMAATSIENQSQVGLTPNANKLALEVTKLLVEAGADINIVGGFGETAIGGALLQDDLNRAIYLIENGGDINHIDRDRLNYMFYCDSIECYEYFLSKGLDINSVTNNGTNILQSSLYLNPDLKLTKRLLELGADLCHKDNEGKSVLNHVEIGDLDERNEETNPSYYQKKLAEHRDTEVFKYLEKEYNKICLENTDKLND